MSLFKSKTILDSSSDDDLFDDDDATTNGNQNDKTETLLQSSNSNITNLLLNNRVDDTIVSEKANSLINGEIAYHQNNNNNNQEEELNQIAKPFGDLWESLESSIINLAKVDPDFISRRTNIIDKSNILKILNNKKGYSRGLKRKLSTNTTSTVRNKSPKKRNMKRKAKNSGAIERIDKNNDCPTCGITETIQWRYDSDDDRWLCNACGLLLSKSKQGGISFEKRIEKRVARMQRKKSLKNK